MYEGWPQSRIDAHRKKSREGMRKYLDDPEWKKRNLERTLKWLEQHPGYTAEHYYKDHEKSKRKAREYRMKHREARLAYSKQYYLKNREAILAKLQAQRDDIKNTQK